MSQRVEVFLDRALERAVLVLRERFLVEKEARHRSGEMGREARSADRWRQMSSSYHTAAERRGGGDGDGEDGDESPPSPPPSAMRRAVRRVGALALGVVGLLYVVGLTGALFDDDDDDGRDGRDAMARAGVGDEAARVTATATATATATHPRVAFVAQKPSVQKTG